MTRSDFDNTFSLFQLSEIIEQATSNREVKRKLETFKCDKNPDLEHFLHSKAITFEKNLRSRTFIYFHNTTKDVSAYFSIAISTLHTDGISPEVIKTLDGYKNDTESIPCFLIGQLGKSSQFNRTKIGEYILEDAVAEIDGLHNIVGGRFILLDAVNNDKVISFYNDNLFFPIEETDSEDIKMIKPYFEIEIDES